MYLLSVVACQIVVGHGEPVVVVFSELFSVSQQLMSLFVSVLSHVLDCQHVAYVADLDANVRKLNRSD